MDEYKVTYNYSTSAVYENNDHWLIGCEIIKAGSYSEAQELFYKMRSNAVIRDIELLN